MKKIKNAQFNEYLVEDVCDNGLKIVVWHKPEFATTSCLFATPYGSLDSSQKTPSNNIIDFPEGIAHFLEHKLFESEDGDVMNKYASLGANVNAFTSYTETVYYFDTSDANIEEPLNLLLDFVQHLNISEESVDKEKGIIAQELNMYLEMPDSRLIFETFKSMYKNHPIKNDIGGTVESVYKITKSSLEECYALNYHPEKMTFIAVTPCDPEKVIQMVKANQAKKTFPNYIPIERHFTDEPAAIFHKDKTITMDVFNPKVCLGFKLPNIISDPVSRVKFDWALRFIFESHFTSINPNYQTWLNDHKISHFFEYETEISKDFSLALFIDEGIDTELFAQFVLDELDVLKEKGISLESLTQLKNRSLGESISLFNHPEAISVQYYRHECTEVNLFDTIELIKNLTIHDCENAIQKIDKSLYCKTVIKSEQDQN